MNDEVEAKLKKGYYFAEPLSPPEFIEFQRNRASRHSLSV